MPCHKLPITQSIPSNLTNQPVYKCLIIKLSIIVVTMVTNHNSAYNRHTWVSTNHRLDNHRPDTPFQNSTAQSRAWKARQAIPEGISLDRLSQSASEECTRKKRLQKPKTSDKQSSLKENTGGQAKLQ